MKFRAWICVLTSIIFFNMISRKHNVTWTPLLAAGWESCRCDASDTANHRGLRRAIRFAILNTLNDERGLTRREWRVMKLYMRYFINTSKREHLRLEKGKL